MKLDIWDDSRFLNSRREWELLHSRSDADALFMSWNWLSSWWRSFKAPKDQLVIYVALADDGRLLGVAPFYKSAMAGVLGNISRMQSLGTSYRGDAIRTEYQGFIVDQLLGEAVSRFLWEAIFNDNSWNELVLGDWQVDALPQHFVGNYSVRGKIHCRVDVESHSYLIDASGCFDDYCRRLGKHTRLKLLNRRKLLPHFGEVWVEDWGQQNFDRFVDVMNVWHDARWGKPMLRDRKYRFYKTLRDQLEDAADLKCDILLLDGRPLAGALNYRAGATLYNLQLGFQEGFDKRISLGTLMLGYMIEKAFHDPGIERIDLLAGRGKHSDYKSHIGDCGSFMTTNHIARGAMGFVYQYYDKYRLLKKKLKKSDKS